MQSRTPLSHILKYKPPSYVQDLLMALWKALHKSPQPDSLQLRIAHFYSIASHEGIQLATDLAVRAVEGQVLESPSFEDSRILAEIVYELMGERGRWKCEDELLEQVILQLVGNF
jgi:hypothetical protein